MMCFPVVLSKSIEAGFKQPGCAWMGVFMDAKIDSMTILAAYV